MSHDTLTPVSPTARRLAAVLDRPVTVEQAALAALFGVSARTVRRSLAELEAVGYLRRERRVDEHGYRSADRLVPTGQTLSSGSRSKGIVAEWTVEVRELRDAMIAAGIRCGWGRLRPDVIADLTRWVRELGIPRLVREAKARIWSPSIRHVAAFLRFWAVLRPERRPVCPFHPTESIDRGRPCPPCSARVSVRMPDELRRGLWRRRPPLLPSDPTRSHPGGPA